MKAFLGNESDLHHERSGRGPESHGDAEISALAFSLCYTKLHSPNSIVKICPFLFGSQGKCNEDTS